MDIRALEIPDKKTRVAEAFLSYDIDEIRVVSRSLAGATHIVATRRGLYAVNEQDWAVIAQGFFFGLTLKDNDIYAFEACDQPHSQLQRGRIVRFHVRSGTIAGSSVLAKGLDNGCHQIDFFHDELHVVDTYRQQILRFASDFNSKTLLSPLPVCPTGRWQPADLNYVHVNSLLRVGESNFLLLHNGSEHTGRKSALVAYDSDWNFLHRTELDGRSCHGLSLLEDGRLIICDSISGDLISADGSLRVHVNSLFTRGLAVGADSVVVGGSLLTKREARMHATGTVTFMDPDYAKRREIFIPGAPMEIRRLDGNDFGISNYLARQGRVKLASQVAEV